MFNHQLFMVEQPLFPYQVEYISMVCCLIMCYHQLFMMRHSVILPTQSLIIQNGATFISLSSKIYQLVLLLNDVLVHDETQYHYSNTRPNNTKIRSLYFLIEQNILAIFVTYKTWFSLIFLLSSLAYAYTNDYTVVKCSYIYMFQSCTCIGYSYTYKKSI